MAAIHALRPSASLRLCVNHHHTGGYTNCSSSSATAAGRGWRVSPRSIAGVRLALLFRQIANGRIKVSFRSMGAVNVAELAHQFGGGGHRKAAGASLEGAMGDVQRTVLDAARAYVVNHAERRAAKR